MHKLEDFYNDSPTKKKTRYEILEAVFELFSEKEIHTVTMLDVADKCRITIRNLYRYYKNKSFLAVDTAFYSFSGINLNDFLPADDNSISGIKTLETILKSFSLWHTSEKIDAKEIKFILNFDFFCISP